MSTCPGVTRVGPGLSLSANLMGGGPELLVATSGPRIAAAGSQGPCWGRTAQFTAQGEVKARGPYSKMMKNFKTAAAEHHAKHRTLVSVGPLHLGHMPRSQPWACPTPSSHFPEEKTEAA